MCGYVCVFGYVSSTPHSQQWGGGGGGGSLYELLCGGVQLQIFRTDREGMIDDVILHGT